ncbi:MAG: MogA/MoaB family molybdenum cofactor biosynthesis protein [Lachnospiraceae bacterium]|jgi:molybdenum cofactor synthesis domain-containing protein|nr:MogA/MoaB family molybdenum cofactor biosynthesis protein [Lachnospiraceae bacterium]MCI9149770.1 MogA/MoaB family molybdenum cofactor biosynthesis protein [Lachnospiraceae bacterium]
MRVAVITSSDSGAAGLREDKSGPLIQEIVTRLGAQVVSCQLLPDEQQQLEEAMRKIADEGQAELILTTGGTGFSQRDCMPEATQSVSERQVPGIPEAMRAYSMQFTGRAMLSRAAAGIRKETLIVNLPGSPKAIGETLEYIYPHLVHGVEILTGAAFDCAPSAHFQERDQGEQSRG